MRMNAQSFGAGIVLDADIVRRFNHSLPRVGNRDEPPARIGWRIRSYGSVWIKAKLPTIAERDDLGIYFCRTAGLAKRRARWSESG